jgi:hypothetical protein
VHTMGAGGSGGGSENVNPSTVTPDLFTGSLGYTVPLEVPLFAARRASWRGRNRTRSAGLLPAGCPAPSVGRAVRAAPPRTPRAKVPGRRRAKKPAERPRTKRTRLRFWAAASGSRGRRKAVINASTATAPRPRAGR